MSKPAKKCICYCNKKAQSCYRKHKARHSQAAPFSSNVGSLGTHKHFVLWSKSRTLRLQKPPCPLQDFLYRSHHYLSSSNNNTSSLRSNDTMKTQPLALLSLVLLLLMMPTLANAFFFGNFFGNMFCNIPILSLFFCTKGGCRQRTLRGPTDQSPLEDRHFLLLDNQNAQRT